jgi:hypothetical protein
MALGESMAVKVPVEGEYGGNYGEPVEVKHVRYEDAATLKTSRYVLSDGTEGVIFIDAVNSVGAFHIPEGSLIDINDDTVTVLKTKPCKGFADQVHHWELEVK